MEQAITYARSKLIDVFSCAKATEGYGTLTVLMANCYDERILKLCNLYWHVNEEIYENIKARDYNDMHKEVGSLTRTEDSIYIDSTNLTIEEVEEA